jgi:hypothetical protein
MDVQSQSAKPERSYGKLEGYVLLPHQSPITTMTPTNTNSNWDIVESQLKCLQVWEKVIYTSCVGDGGEQCGWEGAD